MSTQEPPVAKYRYTLTVTGNTIDEIAEILEHSANELWVQVNGRDEFEIWGGTYERRLEHANPEMTPERYRDELMAWWDARKRDHVAEAAEVRKQARG